MKKISEHFENYFKKVSETLGEVDIESIYSAIDIILECYKKGNTVYIFGNGGSASTASHVAGDFMKGISFGLDKTGFRPSLRHPCALIAKFGIVIFSISHDPSFRLVVVNTCSYPN